MTENRTLTVITTPLDWEGVYLDNKIEYQNHSASITDVSLEANEVIETIESREYNITPLGLNRFPKHLDTLEKLVEFGEQITANSEDWKEAIIQLFNAENKGYLTHEDIRCAFDLSQNEADVIGAMFSKRNSPYEVEAIFEFDSKATRECDTRAYVLIE